MLFQERNKFKALLTHDLCLGCGLCEAIGNKEQYVMTLDDSGFYKPVEIGERDRETEKRIEAICPGININVPKFGNEVWGNVVRSFSGWSNDDEIRRQGSSGGSISALCVFLLNEKLVDGILHVGRSGPDTIENKLMVSRNRDDVLRNASSRYAPSKVFNDLISILDSSHETFCFVGKPCDVAALKKFIVFFPQYADRIKYYFSFFCAGMPSYAGTQKLLDRFNKKELPTTLRYRGDGWPGFFTAGYSSGEVYRISYEESWGEVLGKCVHTRCKICPDGIGLLADIVFGDAWETKEGYPDFEERPGKSILISRTQSGDRLLTMALNGGSITTEPIDENRISKMQPFQHQRRLFVGYRIIVIQILSRFLLSFRSTGYFKLMFKYPIHRGVKNSYGTLRRALFKSNR